MAPAAKKRKLAHNETITAKRPRKAATKRSSKAAPHTRTKRNLRLDDLAWKDVAIPDDLDDFEGLYGLEEADDVEIVRDPQTNTVSYRAAVSTEQNGTPNIEDSDAEEWSGLSSDDEDEMNVLQTRDSGQLGDDGSNADAREPSHVLKGNGVIAEEQTSFAGLEEEDLGEENDIDLSAWASLELSPETNVALSALKFTTPTPIQLAAIPEILGGHDVIGKASTGSGKTLAFGIPILEAYLALDKSLEQKGSGNPPKSPIALILSPTRELAHQLRDHLTALFSHKSFDGPSIATITGGLSLHKQQRLLSNADVVVATPGRLWEIMSSGHGMIGRLKKIRCLVVDEADRLLSQGHFKELEEILAALDRQDDAESAEQRSTKNAPASRQTLVFSATFHKGLQQKLAGKSKYNDGLMNHEESTAYLLQKLNFREAKPKFIDVDPASQMVVGLREGILECAGMEKDLYLHSLLLLQHSGTRTLVFTNSIASVRRLTPLLANLQLPALPLHSGMPQKARLRSVERFAAAKASVLVATDVAARGLDIPGVELVVHYHVPRAADAYVHRSGRTARAGKQGSSVLLCAPEEVAGVRRLVAKVHARSGTAAGQSSAAGLKSLNVDRRVVARLRPRLRLAKRIADVGLAKEKKSAGDAWMKQAAEDLGVEYDSEELDAAGGGKRGRGNGRKEKERKDRAVSKDEVKALRAELRALLAKRVNVGVSERYLTSGGIDVDALLEGQKDEFLGGVAPLGFDV